MFWIWVAIAAVFIVAEIFTAGFFLFPFAVGAGVAALINFLGLPAWLQWVCFLGLSGILVLTSRRLADRFSHEPPEKVGVDRLIGQTGLVIEAIDPVTDSGRVRIKKDEWRATTDDESSVDVNEKVRVVRVEGAHLVVEKTQN
jgi:membrane protein implicated in regulation of membrane protease activity